MEEEKQPKRRGRPPKYAGEGKRQNFSFRIRDAIRERLVAVVEKTGRSLSEEIEWRIEHSFEWEDQLGEFRAWRAKHTATMQEMEAVNARAVLHRLGWQKLPTARGYVWAEPGVSPFPASGFVDPDAPAPEIFQPLQDAPAELAAAVDIETVIERAVIRALEKTGLAKVQDT